MRVLVVVNELEPGGAERMIVDQVKHSTGIEFHVCQLTGGSQLVSELPSTTAVHYLRLAGRLDPRAFTRLRHLTLRTEPALMHAHLPRSGAVAGFVARSLGRPFLYTEHNVWAGYSPLGRPLALAAARFADVVVAVSNEVRTSTLHNTRIPPERVVMIRNGVDLRRLPAATAAPADVLRVCAIGNLYRRKGYPFLLEALAIVRDQAIQMELDAYGDGPERGALVAMAHRLRVADSVRFHGLQPNASSLLGDYHAFVLPSLVEGLPVALIEAMGAGLPVVATCVGGIPELVDDGVNGLLVAAADARGLASALAGLARDGALRARLGDAARATVRERFNIEAVARSYGECYERVIRSRR